jgi:hypothetical protein
VKKLNPPISVEVIGKGPALAVGSTDRGPSYELRWVVISKDGGAITVEPVMSDNYISPPRQLQIPTEPR